MLFCVQTTHWFPCWNVSIFQNFKLKDYLQICK